MIKQLSPCFLKKKSFKFSANLEEKSGIIPVVLQHLVSQIDFFEKHICLMSYFIQLPTLAIMGAAIKMSDSNCFRRMAVFGATIYMTNHFQFMFTMDQSPRNFWWGFSSICFRRKMTKQNFARLSGRFGRFTGLRPSSADNSSSHLFSNRQPSSNGIAS